MKIKEIAIDTIKSFPDNATWEDVKERIEFVAGIRMALKELDEGKGIPHSQIEDESSSWIPK
ncbi:MAG: hypothetical protein DYG83_15365 [Candidatus Brocadia sp. AMX2]|uniref:Uncharacterized protein n=1 Tax=Candidatus Brocadia sinica JPN1 TaxID=1197129 RepID=A0ABQ0K3M3_9BACT|nr:MULTISPECIES: hypothetical protein [Brocadia]MBC6933762.1 hypothetical protein [Candidatus Brocadia sp.]MBL1170123.1 hypothetical protein [Candidatus Brocadia sp. AMX1]MCK6469451.1 hypothetical protein [Candidatus Brocadia sinica]NOG43070.1 hypothetical protein [Planctomycetota bacterium]KAA0242933.1 MAG: hypothetical protein EDM70_12485 [Candidatus Brocadia sp. AMX2]